MDENIIILPDETDDDLAVAIDALDRFLKLPPEMREQVLEKLRELTDD